MARRTPHHYGYGQNGNGGFSEATSHEETTENDYLIDGLKTKVNALKSLSLDMGDEIKSQNAFLKDMDTEFDTTWGSLSRNINRVKRIASSGHTRYIFYLLGFSFFVFFVIYIIMKTR